MNSTDEFPVFSFQTRNVDNGGMSVFLCQSSVMKVLAFNVYTALNLIS